MQSECAPKGNAGLMAIVAGLLSGFSQCTDYMSSYSPGSVEALQGGKVWWAYLKFDCADASTAAAKAPRTLSILFCLVTIGAKPEDSAHRVGCANTSNQLEFVQKN